MATVNVRKQGGVANKRRYFLSDLLHGVTPAKLAKLNAETARAREGKPVGREIA